MQDLIYYYKKQWWYRMTYSIDLRKKVLEYIEGGGSRESACKIFKIHRNSITKWHKLSKQGCLSDPQPNRPWKKINPEALITAVTNNNDWLLADFARLFKVTTAAICLAFKSLNITSGWLDIAPPPKTTRALGAYLRNK